MSPAPPSRGFRSAIDELAGSTGPVDCSGTNCPTFTADLGNGTTVPNTATVASTVEPLAAQFTKANLTTLYNCGTVTIGSTVIWPPGSPTAEPTGAQTIDLYQPQAGSGTRSFWESANGINYPDASPCVHDHIINGALAPANDGNVSVPVEEHDGTAVSTDPLGFGPFSAAQWIAQHTGHNPRYHGAVIQPISGVSSVHRDDPAHNRSRAELRQLPVDRYVYDVVSTPRLTASGDPRHPDCNGARPTVCASKTLIQSYGFGLINANVYLGYTCGETGLAALEGAG